MKNSTDTEQHYIGTAEVATFFGISDMTVRRLCERGDIKGARKIGGQWRIPKTYLDQPQAA